MNGPVRRIAALFMVWCLVQVDCVQAQVLAFEGSSVACATDFSSSTARMSHAEYHEARKGGTLDRARKHTEPYEIGEERVFNVINPLPTGEYGWMPRTFRLAAKEADLYYLWTAVDEGHLVRSDEVDELHRYLVHESPEGSIDPNSGILKNDEALFGAPPDYDGDGYTDIVLYDIRDPSIGGFVSLEDVNPKAPYGNGNQGDVLYIDSPRHVENLLPVIAHEYTHLINVSSGFDFKYTFNVEGYAEFGLVANGYALWRGIRYLYRQSDNGDGQDEYEYRRSLFSWRTDEPGGRDPYLYDYQRANLFFGYVADQFSPEVVGAMLRSPIKGPEGLDGVLRDENTSIGEVINQFHTANYANAREADQRFGYPLPGRPVIVAPATTVFDGEATAQGENGPAYVTVIRDHPIRSGAVEYVRWDGVADPVLDFDIYGASLYPPDEVEARRSTLHGRVIGIREDGRLEFWDVEPGDPKRMYPGSWTSLVLAASHTDPSIDEGVRFRLTAGWTPLSQVSTVAETLPNHPNAVSIGPNFPNPFLERTTLPVDVSRGLPGSTELKIYSVLGRLVRRFSLDAKSRGRILLEWDGRTEAGDPAPAGVYLYVLFDGVRTRSGRLTKVE